MRSLYKIILQGNNLWWDINEEVFKKVFKTIKSPTLRSGFDNYSHSIVAGGFEEISYTTLFTPFTLLIISLEISAKKSYGK